jgi:hypothetical protein
MLFIPAIMITIASLFLLAWSSYTCYDIFINFKHLTAIEYFMYGFGFIALLILFICLFRVIVMLWKSLLEDK